MTGLKHLTTSCASLFNIISHLCLLDCHPVSCIFWIAILCLVSFGLPSCVLYLLDCHPVSFGLPCSVPCLLDCHPVSCVLWIAMQCPVSFGLPCSVLYLLDCHPVSYVFWIAMQLAQCSVASRSSIPVFFIAIPIQPTGNQRSMMRCVAVCSRWLYYFVLSILLAD